METTLTAGQLERLLGKAETARDSYHDELEGMVRRLRRLISAGLVSEEAGEYIRTGAEDMGADAKLALADQMPAVPRLVNRGAW